MVDAHAVRHACHPIARWWQAYQHGDYPDPERLAKAAARAKLLGPVPGTLGAALGYILNGPDDLDYPRLHTAFTTITAFTIITAAAASDDIDLGHLILHDPTGTNRGNPDPVQLCLAGMGAPSTGIGRRSGKGRR